MFVLGLCASACLFVLGKGLPARAMLIAPPPGPMRLAQADTVVVGQVVALEDQDVDAAVAPGIAQKTKYRIARVKVREAIKGGKGADVIRVGFLAPPTAQPGLVQPGVIRPGIRRGGINLQVGNDGLFYLNPHHQEKFYVAPAYYSFTSSQVPNFKEEVSTAKRTVKLLEDPMAGLKSKDAQERLLTASLLVARYRTAQGGALKTQPIDAAESKLILTALAEADWNQPFRFGQMHPQQAFGQLGLTKEDGWNPPQVIRTPQDFGNAAREWLRTHADTYRIKRFVAGGA
jgi:hypothetical protein